jgi:hypothetical protein
LREVCHCNRVLTVLTCAAGAARATGVSGADVDGSRDSFQSYDSGHSKRSSFALERASLSLNRGSLEAFSAWRPALPVPHLPLGITSLCLKLGIPESMKDRHAPLL